MPTIRSDSRLAIIFNTPFGKRALHSAVCGSLARCYGTHVTGAAAGLATLYRHQCLPERSRAHSDA